MKVMLFAVAFSAVIASVIYLLNKRKESSKKPPAVRIEYWIYCNAQERPQDKDLLDRMLASSPYHKRGSAPIGPAEGVFFSDIRLHIATVKREKNAMLFRPEIFVGGDSMVDSSIPKLISETNTIIIVRFVSEAAERKRGYISFVTYAAEAIAALTSANLIWDTVTEEFLTPEELAEKLKEDNDGSRFALHVAARWTETAEAGRAFTRGMGKAGLPDIELDRQPLDQKVLALTLVEESARRCWESGTLDPVEFSGFGELFLVDFSVPRPGSPTHQGWLSTLHAVRKRVI